MHYSLILACLLNFLALICYLCAAVFDVAVNSVNYCRNADYRECLREIGGRAVSFANIVETIVVVALWMIREAFAILWLTIVQFASGVTHGDKVKQDERLTTRVLHKQKIE